MTERMMTIDILNLFYRLVQKILNKAVCVAQFTPSVYVRQEKALLIN